MTQYLIESDGTYVGAFSNGSAALASALTIPGRTLVSSAPDDARQKWSGSAWGAPPAALTPQQIATALLNGTDFNSILWRGLIGALATQFGKTPTQVFMAIVNAAN